MDPTKTILTHELPLEQLSSWEKLLTAVFSRLTALELEFTSASGRQMTLGAGERRADVKLNTPKAARRILLGGSMGFAEAWMEGELETRDLSRLLVGLGAGQPSMGRFVKGTSRMLWHLDRFGHSLRRNTKRNAKKNIQEHYDLSNELYETFLDPTLTYSSAWFEDMAGDLEEAQFRKIDRLIEEMGLSPEHHVLEIGSGWGACAIRMAQQSGCRVTSLTLSEEQAQEARTRIAAAGLEDRVEIRLQDYRDVQGEFDHAVSVEMIEAVGHSYLPGYFQAVSRLLKPGGRFALQAICITDDRYEEYNSRSDFIRKYIFPGGHLPCPKLLGELSSQVGLVQQNELEFGLHYAETLRRWRDDFNERLPRVRELGFDERFIRKWQYYLSFCEAGFENRMIDVRQITYSKSLA